MRPGAKAIVEIQFAGLHLAALNQLGRGANQVLLSIERTVSRAGAYSAHWGVRRRAVSAPLRRLLFGALVYPSNAADMKGFVARRFPRPQPGGAAGT
jgi:hypothetical protein